MGMRFLAADQLPDAEVRPGPLAHTTLTCFSQTSLQNLYPEARADLRFKSRGVVLLTWLLRDLLAGGAPASTGTYLACLFGPYSPRLQQLARDTPSGRQRLEVLERALPPKDYFIATPATKAAQLSIEFGLHGPLMALYSPEYASQQAVELARADLADGVVEAAVVASIFALEDESEVPRYLNGHTHLVEAVAVQFARSADQLLDAPAKAGRYGPLTSYWERNPEK